MLQDLASLAEIIGAIGVMVSLIFVGLQVMQANQLAREAAEQKQIEAIGSLSRIIAENPRLREPAGYRLVFAIVGRKTSGTANPAGVSGKVTGLAPEGRLQPRISGGYDRPRSAKSCRLSKLVTTVRSGVRVQSVDATVSLNRSAGVWKSSVSLGRSLS
jgi:hypothetical protein